MISVDVGYNNVITIQSAARFLCVFPNIRSRNLIITARLVYWTFSGMQQKAYWMGFHLTLIVTM